MPARFPRWGYLSIGTLATISMGLRAANLRTASDYVALFGLLGMFSSLFNALCCLALTTNAPLADAAYARADAALGFDWVAYHRWLQSDPNLQWLLKICYYSAGPEIVGCAVLLCLLGRTRDYQHFVWSLLISLAIAATFNAVAPALGAGYFYGANEPFWVAGLLAIRAHTGNVASAFGSVSFPSFHTVIALLCPYAVRYVRWLVLEVLILNGAMLFSIPIEGSHYLVDMIGGGVTAVLAVVLANYVMSRFESVY